MKMKLLYRDGKACVVQICSGFKNVDSNIFSCSMSGAFDFLCAEKNLLAGSDWQPDLNSDSHFEACCDRAGVKK